MSFGDKIIDTTIGVVIGGAILLGGAHLLSSCASETVNSYRGILDPPITESVREDLNGNGLLEKYVELNGKKYFSEIDGKPVQEYIQK